MQIVPRATGKTNYAKIDYSYIYSSTSDHTHPWFSDPNLSETQPSSKSTSFNQIPVGLSMPKLPQAKLLKFPNVQSLTNLQDVLDNLITTPNDQNSYKQSLNEILKKYMKVRLEEDPTDSKELSQTKFLDDFDFEKDLNFTIEAPYQSIKLIPDSSQMIPVMITLKANELPINPDKVFFQPTCN